MTLLSDDLKNKLNSLLNRLNGTSKSVVILNLSPEVNKGDLKNVLDFLIDTLNEGTLCVIGDCSFNTNDSDLHSLAKIDSAKRNIVYTSTPLKVMGLYDDVYYMNHPSLEIAVKGEYAQHLTRHQSLDFPYGDKSIFADLYELDAILISLGRYCKPYPLKYGANHKDKVIVKNNCLYNDEIFPYLDFDFNYEEALKVFEGEILFEESEPLIYGERYRYLISEVKKQLD